jgi:hypothetical protein
LQLLVDFELFDLADFETKYSRHGSFNGFIESVGFGENVGFGDVGASVGLGGLVLLSVGSIVVALASPASGGKGLPPIWGEADGALVVDCGGIVGLPIALLQNAGQALETSLTVTHPALLNACTGSVSLVQLSI